MTCGNCARHVREALLAVAGVISVDVQLETTSAIVGCTTDLLDPAASLIAALHAAGYGSVEAINETNTTATSTPLSGWRSTMVLGVVATASMMAAEWLLNLGSNRVYHWVAFALASSVQWICGPKFFRGAWSQLRAGRSNMDTLVSLGSMTAYLFSVWGLFAGWPGHLYFMDAAAIITLISMGHHLESRMATRAESSLRSLLQLTPTTALRIGSDGLEIEVPAESLRPDDLVVLRAGDKIPTDGDVVEGQSAVNEAMLTGESLPVEKVHGSKLFGGTLNESSRLVMRVTTLGKDTALAQIIQVVRRAQSSRAHIQRLGDKVSNVFVPVVIGIALITGLWWGLAQESAHGISQYLAGYLWMPHVPDSALASAVFHAAAVLIIACPCAMGLATPIAIMAGTNAAARRGILIRDGSALEKSGTITTILFDKTGTLTQGKFRVSSTYVAADYPGDLPKADSLAAALAENSKHPLSKAIATLANTKLALKDFLEIRGSGLSAQFVCDNKSHNIQLGSIQWINQNRPLPEWVAPFVNQHSRQAATVIAMGVDNQLCALFALIDPIKPRAADTLQQLSTAGYELHLVSGDQTQTVLALASQVGIANPFVHAQISPEGKADLILKLQGQGHRVAFVGDGINDAPALKQSDLGIAMTQASDVARDAADMLLLNSDIEAIPMALNLAQATLRTIKQNLFWAFFYNAAAIPLAMFGFLSPILSAVAMGLSDLIVIGNSLRLKKR